MNNLSSEILENWKKKSLEYRKSSYEERIAVLDLLKKEIDNNKELIIDALKEDLSKPHIESYLTELSSVYQEIHYYKKELKQWMAKKKVKSPLTLLGSRNFIQYEAKGFVLVLSPWNYPFQLSIMPLIAALGAGNLVCLKASEFSPNTSQVIYQIINNSDLKNYILCVSGDHNTASELTNYPFDHIFFTGSTNVAKKIMASAAKNLSPLTLELGGKCPCIVDKSANIKKSAKKIVWGKFMNAGQTCVAPDYLLVHQDVVKDLIKELKENILKNYGNNKSDIMKNKNYGRIINKKHVQRLTDIKEKIENDGGELITGGDYSEEDNYFSPTIFKMKQPTIYEEEIFGPILPIISYNQELEIETFINKHKDPLAIYFFTKNKDIVDRISKSQRSGAIVINTIASHLANHYLPFGGVGASGFGKYHGKWGFEEFSYLRSYHKLKKYNVIDYFLPPYSEKFEYLFNKLKNIFLKIQ